MDREREVVARIAQRLRERRADLGITQADLADQLGVTQAYLSRLETGEATIQMRRLVRALSAVGLDLIAVPRTHPAAREERMRPLRAPRRTSNAAALDKLQSSLDQLDLDRISSVEVAERLRMLQTILAQRDVNKDAPHQARELARPLRRLADDDAALGLVDPALNRVLRGLREAYPHPPREHGLPEEEVR